MDMVPNKTPVRRRQWRLVVLAILSIATALLCLGVATNAFVIGIRNQWVWPHQTALGPYRLWVFGGPALGLVLLAIGLRRIAAGGRWTRGLALGGIVALGFFAAVGVKSVVSPGTPYLLGMIASRSSTSYFVEARQLADDDRGLRAWLHAYSERMPTMLGHARTHPPGAVLFYRVFIGIARTNSPLTRAAGKALVAIAGEDAESLTTEFGHIQGHLPYPWEHTWPDVVAAWLIALALALCAALVAVPIYRIMGDARAGGSPLAGLCGALLWVTVPSALCFTPQLDQFLCLVAAGSVCLFALGLRSNRWGWSAASGACVAVGIFTSFGLAVIAAMLVLWGALARRRKAAPPLLFFAAGVVVPLVAVALIAGMDWAAIARTAAELHRVEITQAFPRRYGPWLGWNVLEVLLFGGLAVAGWMAVHLARRARGRTGPRTDLDWLFLAWVLALVVLDLSGGTRGETARIWLFLMPPMAMAAGSELALMGGAGRAGSVALNLAQVLVFEVSLGLLSIY
jgi:hypothetical protein